MELFNLFKRLSEQISRFLILFGTAAGRAKSFLSRPLWVLMAIELGQVKVALVQLESADVFFLSINCALHGHLDEQRVARLKQH